MARYSAFLGRSVEVLYRAGDILLPASGTFVADSGRSIFLEQSIEQRGQHKHFRWEIPYQYLVRIEEKAAGEASSTTAQAAEPSRGPATALPEANSAGSGRTESSSAAASATNGQNGILGLPPQRPKTA